tara:strand:- start:737 stop:946 length:210 start_codon:yes stop_codon:yes gene_type:complete
MSKTMGMPKVGKRNARRITRAESDVTGLPRWVEIYTSPATGETAFKNCQLGGGAKDVFACRKALNKYWS